MSLKYLLFILPLALTGCVLTSTTSNVPGFSFPYLNKYNITYPNDTNDIKLTILEKVVETRFNKQFKGEDYYKNHIRKIELRALVIVDETGERFDTLQLINPTLSPD